MDFECIWAILARGRADYVVEKAKEAGAKGATVFFARGTGIHEAHKFLGIVVDASKEVVFILVDRNATDRVFDAVVHAGQIDKPGTGIAFTTPVGRLVGMAHREALGEANG